MSVPGRHDGLARDDQALRPTASDIPLADHHPVCYTRNHAARRPLREARRPAAEPAISARPATAPPLLPDRRAIHLRMEACTLPLLDVTREIIALVEKETGYPVQLLEEPSLQTLATVRMARGNVPAHFVLYKPTRDESLDYRTIELDAELVRRARRAAAQDRVARVLLPAHAQPRVVGERNETSSNENRTASSAVAGAVSEKR